MEHHFLPIARVEKVAIKPFLPV